MPSWAPLSGRTGNIFKKGGGGERKCKSSVSPVIEVGLQMEIKIKRIIQKSHSGKVDFEEEIEGREKMAFSGNEFLA